MKGDNALTVAVCKDELDVRIGSIISGSAHPTACLITTFPEQSLTAARFSRAGMCSIGLMVLSGVGYAAR
jgi:hypothetical protein